MGRAHYRPETFLVVERNVFTGLTVARDSENESAVIFRRCVRIDRACAIARMKSLKWLSRANLRFPDFLEERRLAAIDRLVNKKA